MYMSACKQMFKKHTLFATKLIIKRNIVCIQIRVIRLQQRFHSPKFRKNCYYETFEHLNITMMMMARANIFENERLNS